MFCILLNIKLYQSGIITRVSLIQLIEVFTNTTGGYKIQIKGREVTKGGGGGEMKYKGGIKLIANYTVIHIFMLLFSKFISST